jgi:hypothetical protein
MLPAAEKIVLVLEGIGDDKIRVNSSSLDQPLTILPDQGIEIVGIEKKVMVGAREADWSRRGTVRRPGNGVARLKRRYGVRNGVSETAFRQCNGVSYSVTLCG